MIKILQAIIDWCYEWHAHGQAMIDGRNPKIKEDDDAE